MSNDWTTTTSWDEVYRRAGGRKHYNAWRQTVRNLRRLQVARLLSHFPLARRGSVRAIARALGVHPSTICRDLKAILFDQDRCPRCGQWPLLEARPENPELAEELLAGYQANILSGKWQWAARGPLPRGAD